MKSDIRDSECHVETCIGLPNLALNIDSTIYEQYAPDNHHPICYSQSETKIIIQYHDIMTIFGDLCIKIIVPYQDVMTFSAIHIVRFYSHYMNLWLSG